MRWRIGLSSGEPLAIAGLWRSWKEADGGEALSFTMLTVNADGHPLTKRFHRPGSEKRSVVIVPEAKYAPWLTCRNTDEAYSHPACHAKQQDWGVALGESACRFRGAQHALSLKSECNGWRLYSDDVFR